MTTRILDSSEWAAKLVGTELEVAIPYLPADTQVIVVEDEDGHVVGCWSVICYVHVEGVWIAPPHRKRGTVARRLLRAMRQVVRSLGASVVLTGADTDDVRQLLGTLGATKLPGDHYKLPIPPER
jgi:hypothetical protein